MSATGMKWKQVRVKEMPESVVVMVTENFLDGVKPEDANAFANNFGRDLNKRLRKMGYHKVRFEGPKDAGGKVWGDGPGPWLLRVLLQGGRWAYHSAAIERLVEQQMEFTYAQLALVQAQRDAQASTGSAEAKAEVQKSLIVVP